MALSKSRSTVSESSQFRYSHLLKGILPAADVEYVDERWPHSRSERSRVCVASLRAESWHHEKLSLLGNKDAIRSRVQIRAQYREKRKVDGDEIALSCYYRMLLAISDFTNRRNQPCHLKI